MGGGSGVCPPGFKFDLGFQTLTVPTQRLGRYGCCSEREEESAEFKKKIHETFTLKLSVWIIDKQNLPLEYPENGLGMDLE